MNESRLSLSESNFADVSSTEIYPLKGVIESKQQEARVLAHQYYELVENDDEISNETFIDFNKFVKDRSDYIRALSMEIKDSKPVVYPKSHTEACYQLKGTLTNELEELQEMIKQKKGEIADVVKERQRYITRAEAMSELMEMAESKKEEEETIDAIERKILDSKFKEAQKRLNFTLKTVFPKHYDALSQLLAKLCDEEEEEAEFSEEDYKLSLLLMRANIIKRDPLDPRKLSLLKS